MSKTVTVREFIDAVRKNGLKQITGELFQYIDPYDNLPTETSFIERFSNLDTKIVGACAYGQALINLGVHRPDGIGNPYTPHGALFKAIWQLNDGYWGRTETPQEIANALEYTFHNRLDETLEFEEFDYSHLLPGAE